jgi:hypothetical protein
MGHEGGSATPRPGGHPLATIGVAGLLLFLFFVFSIFYYFLKIFYFLLIFLFLYSATQTVKIWTKNLIDVSNRFLPLIQVPPVIQNKIEVLNLKTLKTQVPIKYLIFIFN